MSENNDKVNQLERIIDIHNMRLSHIETVVEKIEGCMTTQTTILSRVSENILRLQITMEMLSNLNTTVDDMKKDMNELKVEVGKQQETIGTFKKILAGIGTGLVGIITKMLVG